MQVYLMRHGIAMPRGEVDIDDSERALTPEGVEKVHRIGNALRRLKIEIDEIWTSPLLRARQTAEIVAAALAKTPAMQTVRALEPGGNQPALVDLLRSASGLRGVLLVGHEPDMGELAGRLVCGGPGACFRFKKGGIACIEVNQPFTDGLGQMCWFMTPRQMSMLK